MYWCYKTINSWGEERTTWQVNLDIKFFNCKDGWQKLTNVVKEQNYVLFVLNIKNKGQIKSINQTLVIYTSAK